MLTPGAEFSVELEATASGKTEITRLLVQKQRTLAFLTVSKSPMTVSSLERARWYVSSHPQMSGIQVSNLLITASSIYLAGK